jgi:DNA-binding response OmpR family regulator
MEKIHSATHDGHATERVAHAVKIIMLVDTNQVTRNILAEALTADGMEVIEADDNAHALDKLWSIAKETYASARPVESFVSAIVVCRSVTGPVNRTLLGVVKKIRAMAATPVISFMVEGNGSDEDRIVERVRAILANPASSHLG